MSYDNDGLGIAELMFIALNYPEIYGILETLMDKPVEALSLARKVIKVHNLGMIGG